MWGGGLEGTISAAGGLHDIQSNLRLLLYLAWSTPFVPATPAILELNTTLKQHHKCHVS